MELETVKIKNNEGYIIINKSDFDSDKHKLYGVKDSPKQDDMFDKPVDKPVRKVAKQ